MILIFLLKTRIKASEARLATQQTIAPIKKYILYAFRESIRLRIYSISYSSVLVSTIGIKPEVPRQKRIHPKAAMKEIKQKRKNQVMKSPHCPRNPKKIHPRIKLRNAESTMIFIVFLMFPTCSCSQSSSSAGFTSWNMCLSVGRQMLFRQTTVSQIKNCLLGSFDGLYTHESTREFFIQSREQFVRSAGGLDGQALTQTVRCRKFSSGEAKQM